MIKTILGDMEESLLDKKTGGVDTDNEITSWVEYYFEGVLVHRSVHVHLKHNVVADAFATFIG